MDSDIVLLEKLLKEHGYSITKTRKTVLLFMANKPPMTMTDIVAGIPVVDRSSIYRTIALFESIGVVHRIQIGWKYKLELSDKFNPHHHHVVCTSCGEIAKLPPSHKIEKLLDMMISELQFTPISHQIEVTGMCLNCSTK